MLHAWSHRAQSAAAARWSLYAVMGEKEAQPRGRVMLGSTWTGLRGLREIRLSRETARGLCFFHTVYLAYNYLSHAFYLSSDSV